VTRIQDAPRDATNWPTSGFTFQDPFDSKNTTNWTWSSYQSVIITDTSNNVIKNSGTNASYDANFYRNSYSLTSGKGLQLRFKVDATNNIAVFAVEASDATYRRFGVVADGGRLYAQYNDGAGYRSPVDVLTSLQVNTWYVLRIVVNDVRGFYLEAYQENNSAIRGSYNTWMPTGMSWRFHHWVYRGNAYLDDYREFTTSAMTLSPDERMTFGYDALDRLTSAAPESGAQGYSESYQYNAIGNITYTSRLGNYIYPNPGQPRPHAATAAGSNAYTYDANGNMTRRVELSGTQRITYTQAWDAENRLIAVTNTTTLSATRFYYDGDGKRVKKVEGGQTTIYIGSYFEKNISANILDFGQRLTDSASYAGSNSSDWHFNI
jgi:YD repeat-containing protein